LWLLWLLLLLWLWLVVILISNDLNWGHFWLNNYLLLVLLHLNSLGSGVITNDHVLLVDDNDRLHTVVVLVVFYLLLG